MRDVISINRCLNLHPKVAAEVIKIIDEIEANFPPNAKVRIVQGLRTIDEQNKLYAQGRTEPGHRVTNARGGSSYHNYGLAIDFAILYNDKELSWDIDYDFDKDGVKDWQEVVQAFKKHGWKWGGDWQRITDNPHLEKNFGVDWRELLRRYKAGNFIAGSKYVNV